MSEVSMDDVKKLRERTGAGYLDCKKALIANNSDIETAIDWLRTKGLAAAAKKSGNVAAKGVVGALVSANKGALVELNSETDFVARNEQFQQLAMDVLAIVAKTGTTNVEQLLTEKLPSGLDLQSEINNKVAVIGENIRLRRAAYFSVNKGLITKYIHNSFVDGLGTIAVIVALESESQDEKVQTLAKQLAMHIAATKPQALSVDNLDQSIVERERQVVAEQAKASGKPDNVVEKMVEGRIKKFYAEVVLLEQSYVFNDKVTIQQLINDTAKEVGNNIKLANFGCYIVGEGIEDKESMNFADEVKSLSGN